MKDEQEMTGREGGFLGFTKTNGYILLASILLIVAGYILMSGGSSADGVSFDEAVFSARRIVVGPVVCTLGYFGIVAAILYKGKRS